MAQRTILGIALIIAGVGTLGSLPSVAQGNPSADQIIKSLRPGGSGLLGGTRGIRPVAPFAEPAPVPAADPAAAPSQRPAPHAAAPAHQAAAGHPGMDARTAQEPPSVSLTVQFANNSAGLTPAATSTLNELGRALSSATLSTYRFRIEGHTDTVGPVELNKALSDKRAKAVVDYLAARFKIEPSRLEAVGMGADGLLVQTPPNTAEPRNRRVTVINLGA